MLKHFVVETPSASAICAVGQFMAFGNTEICKYWVLKKSFASNQSGPGYCSRYPLYSTISSK